MIYSHGNEKDTYYYILNQQGDVIRIVDTSGKTVSEYTYNGWGEILNVSNAKNSEIGTLNPIRYRGYYYDSELNMYYLQSRYYDPVMKRMICADDENITEDSTMSNHNLFTYCDNNPVNRADVEGDIWNVVAGAIVGASISATVEFLGQKIAGEKIDAGSIAIAAGTGATSKVAKKSGTGSKAQGKAVYTTLGKIKKCGAKLVRAMKKEIKKTLTQRLFQFHFKGAKWFYRKIRDRGRKK